MYIVQRECSKFIVKKDRYEKIETQLSYKMLTHLNCFLISNSGIIYKCTIVVNSRGNNMC